MPIQWLYTHHHRLGSQLEIWADTQALPYRPTQWPGKYIYANHLNHLILILYFW